MSKFQSAAEFTKAYIENNSFMKTFPEAKKERFAKFATKIDNGQVTVQEMRERAIAERKNGSTNDIWEDLKVLAEILERGTMSDAEIEVVYKA